MEEIRPYVGEIVEDPDEELYAIITTPRPPPPSLGFLSPSSNSLEITISDKAYTIKQSPGLLASSHKGGTTGAVVWKISVPLAEALLESLQKENPIITPESSVLELGSGIAGLLAVSVGVNVKKWVCTDIETMLKGLRENIRDNLPESWTEARDGVFEQGTSKKRVIAKKRGKSSGASEQGIAFSSKRIEVGCLNWETDDIEHHPSLTENGRFLPLDLLVCSDCVYNYDLIPPLVSVLVAASQQSYRAGKLPKALVVLEVRSEDVLETWLKEFHTYFHCGRLRIELLGQGWESNGGETGVAFLGVLREHYFLDQNDTK